MHSADALVKAKHDGAFLREGPAKKTVGWGVRTRGDIRGTKTSMTLLTIMVLLKMLLQLLLMSLSMSLSVSLSVHPGTHNHSSADAWVLVARCPKRSPPTLEYHMACGAVWSLPPKRGGGYWPKALDT